MTNLIFGSILAYKYFIIFPLAILEGNTVALISGFFISLGNLNFILVYIALLLGDWIPDIVLYRIGLRGNERKFLEKHGHKIGLSSLTEESLKHLWSKHGNMILIFSKIAYGMAVPVLISAGLVRYSFKKYMAYCTIVSSIKVLIVLTIGYFLGSSYQAATGYIHAFYVTATIVIIIIITFYIYFTRKIKNKLQELEKEV